MTDDCINWVFVLVAPLYIAAVWAFLQMRQSSGTWEAKLEGAAWGLAGAAVLHRLGVGDVLRSTGGEQHPVELEAGTLKPVDLIHWAYTNKKTTNNIKF